MRENWETCEKNPWTLSLDIILGHFQHPPWTLCPLHGHFHTLMVTFLSEDGDIFCTNGGIFVKRWRHFLINGDIFVLISDREHKLLTAILPVVAQLLYGQLKKFGSELSLRSEGAKLACTISCALSSYFNKPNTISGDTSIFVTAHMPTPISFTLAPSR